MSRVRRALAAPVLALTLTTGLAGCTDDDGGGAGPGAGGGDNLSSADRSKSERSAVATTATYGAVTGRLARDRRANLKRAVTEVVDSYFDAAYVGGRWPRSRVGRAFPHFTDGAEANARRDARVLSNQVVGKRLRAVQATKRKVVLDVLALDGKPVAVTARFVLGFETRGGGSRSEEVRGRLFLTRPGDTWRVFGYDVTRGGARKGGAA